MVASSLEREVRERAGHRCEYCHIPVQHSPWPFQLDHVIAEKHKGQTTSDNLALSCWRCNLHKGPNIAGLDPLSGALTALFHPRRDVWVAHFQWDNCRLRGLTAIGRTTIAVLRINDPLYIAAREALAEAGLFIPAD